MSKSQVSRLCAEIDERVNAFLSRPLEGAWRSLVARTMYGWLPRGKIVSVEAGMISVAAMYTASGLQHGGCAP